MELRIDGVSLLAGQSVNLTLMTATLDYPYLEEKAAGYRIASLPYENEGKQWICIQHCMVSIPPCDLITH